MEYWICWGYNIAVLKDAVNEAMSDGWVCQGGVATMPNSYHQAMVKLPPLVASREDVLGNIDFPK